MAHRQISLQNFDFFFRDTTFFTFMIKKLFRSLSMILKNYSILILLCTINEFSPKQVLYD